MNVKPWEVDFWLERFAQQDLGGVDVPYEFMASEVRKDLPQHSEGQILSRLSDLCKDGRISCLQKVICPKCGRTLMKGPRITDYFAAGRFEVICTQCGHSGGDISDVITVYQCTPEYLVHAKRSIGHES